MSGRCVVKFWKAGGWHAHVTRPDGSWERHVWKAHEHWQGDALLAELFRRYGRENVEVSA